MINMFREIYKDLLLVATS